ncbi:ribosomal protein S6 kinase-related protein isoform X3 [Lathamus discolor]|uniref:ribosomal protein S6 kinase-related protein isoform X3 n=1 Tax=Lathamus discolor TaxID=678569 RepID=UPI0032B737C7
MGASSSGPGPAPVRPPQGRAAGSWVRALLGRPRPVPGSGLALVPRGSPEEPPLPGWPLPQLVSLFLPEFPVRPSARQQQLKILGFVAKGSFGTILKVLDCGREKVCAVKVVPKVEVLRRDTLKQCKEEVSIQRQVRHPFVHGLGDSWQGQRHLFIMCTYCSTGDLHALWRVAGSFTEATVRLFAAELVLVLVYLHDLGIIHRDVKMENILLDERGHLKLTDFGLSRHLQWGERAHTICGTLQYMAPEVLSGGPYSHAADWWSLGVLLFALASGEFPVAPAGDHVAMLERVKQSSYESPPAFSPALARLMAEAHPFFRGVAFDADLLQKDPVPVAVAPQPPEQPPPAPATFDDFDCDLEVPSTAPPGRPWPG